MSVNAFGFGPIEIAGHWYAVVGDGDDAHVRHYGLDQPNVPSEVSSIATDRAAAQVPSAAPFEGRNT
jgi:hypothetical protein